MPTYTENYNLTKPLNTDLYDVNVFNSNMEAIDAALKTLRNMSPRDIGALAEKATYYSSTTELNLDAATQSLLLVDKKWSKDCPLCKDSGFVFIVQLFFGEPSATANRTQIAFSYGDAGDNVESGIAIRCYFNGVWTSWTELYGPHNKPTAADLGVASSDHRHDLATYYSSSAAPDIDTLTHNLMLIPNEYSKDCPVGGGFVYIMQLFYGGNTATNNRTQIAYPYMADGSVGKGIATRSYYNGTWTAWNLLSSSSDYRIRTYSSLAEIGLTPGSETIDSIVSALGANAELIYATGAGYADIYPDIYGMLRVTCLDSSRVHFRWTSKSINVEYVGMYSYSNADKWTGWRKVYNTQYPPTCGEIGIIYSSTEPTHKAGQIWLQPIE